MLRCQTNKALKKACSTSHRQMKCPSCNHDQTLDETVSAKNADFEKFKKQGSAVAYAWYVWEKGYKGDTIVKWFN